MPFIASPVSVTTSPTLLINPSTASASDPMPAALINNGAESLFIGGSAVSTTNGFLIPAGGSITFQLISGDQVWGICVAGPIDVRVLKGRS